MSDYHATQLTGSACGPFNCASASAAMAIHAGTGGKVTITSDDVRRLSGASCVPGAHSGSGGLYISDVIRVCRLYSVPIDYGTGPDTYRRWSEVEARSRLASGQGAVFLGSYGRVPAPYRASTSFRGDHSLWAHDLRDGTVCWHDPLRAFAIRVPAEVLIAYWQEPGPLRGYAGWVRDTRPRPSLPATDTEEDMLVVATVTPYPDGARRWRVAAGVTLHGYDPASPGKVIRSMTFAAASSASADADVWVSSPVVPKGGPFLRVTNGVFVGLLIVRSLVTVDDPPPAPAPDCAAAEAAAHNAALEAAAAAVAAAIAAVPRR